MAGTAGLPHVIIRFYTVPKVKDARISVGWALLFIAILYTTAPAIAVFARTNLLNTVSEQPYSEMPEWFTTWESTGLISGCWTQHLLTANEYRLQPYRIVEIRCVPPGSTLAKLK